MLNDRLAQFRDLQKHLLDNIENYDTPEFRAVDAQASVVFDSILQLSPDTPQQAQALIHFLLDMIAGDPEIGNRRAIERVRQLTGSLVTCAQKKMPCDGRTTGT